MSVWEARKTKRLWGSTTHLRDGLDVLCDQAPFFPVMVSLQVARELGVDGQIRLYADDDIAGLVCDPSNCENISSATMILGIVFLPSPRR